MWTKRYERLYLYNIIQISDTTIERRDEIAFVLLFTTWTYFCFIHFFNHVVGAFCYSTTETIEITESSRTNSLNLEFGPTFFSYFNMSYYTYGTKLVCHCYKNKQLELEIWFIIKAISFNNRTTFLFLSLLQTM